MKPSLMYIAADGSYGDATGLRLVDSTGFALNDYEAMDAASDDERQDEAERIAKYLGNGRIDWCWMTDAEGIDIMYTLTGAMQLGRQAHQPKLIERLKNIANVMLRSGITH